MRWMPVEKRLTRIRNMQTLFAARLCRIEETLIRIGGREFAKGDRTLRKSVDPEAYYQLGWLYYDLKKWKSRALPVKIHRS